MASFQNRGRLLQLALPLIQTHAFSRQALKLTSQPPLSETAVSSLFGVGEQARRTLINAWLDEGLNFMKLTPPTTVRDILQARLVYNLPVLGHIPEAYALLASPQSGFLLDPRPGLKHVARIADEACHLSGESSTHLSWYARRGSLAAIYGAAELHQLTSPKTAPAFLDSLLDVSLTAKSSVDELSLYGSYIVKSWSGILKSTGIL